MSWKEYQNKTAMKLTEELKLTEEQEREWQAMALWGERHIMTDEQLMWMAEYFPEFFEIKDEIFDMKKFESAFKI